MEEGKRVVRKEEEGLVAEDREEEMEEEEMETEDMEVEMEEKVKVNGERVAEMV